MCGIVGSVVTLAAGAILVILSTVITFVVVPVVMDNTIINSVALINDTVQMDRFQEVPFSLNFSVRIFNVSNPSAVMNGAVPVINEVGPFVYRLYQQRNISKMEKDTVTYRRVEFFEFDTQASYPHTEDDMLTIVNVPYHAILQMAEQNYPELMSVLPLALGGVFGQNNSPFMTVRVGDLVKDQVTMCNNPGLIGTIACTTIRQLAANAVNIVANDDGSLGFSLLANKHNNPTVEYQVYRGINNPLDLGRIRYFDNAPYFKYWTDYVDEDGVVTRSRCNDVNGTDGAIFPPFLNRSTILYGVNPDICRSVQLRYQRDTEYEGIPAYRFSANEWFLDNDDGCFCLNITKGITQENGCLLKGAMELFTCVGGHMVLSYPHFLYADPTYRNAILGMTPVEDNHRIFMDIEPMTGTPMNGAKRAQFNIFLRPINGIAATQNLRLTLTPIFWIEEGYRLPPDFVAELKDRMIRPLNLLNILLPTIIAVCCVVLLVGGILTIRARKKQMSAPATPTQSQPQTDN